MLSESHNENSRRDKWIYGAKSQTNSCHWWRKVLHGKGHKAACRAAGHAQGLDPENGHTHVCMCPSSYILQICTFCGMKVIHSWWGFCLFLFFKWLCLKKETQEPDLDLAVTSMLDNFGKAPLLPLRAIISQQGDNATTVRKGLSRDEMGYEHSEMGYLAQCLAQRKYSIVSSYYQ